MPVPLWYVRRYPYALRGTHRSSVLQKAADSSMDGATLGSANLTALLAVST